MNAIDSSSIARAVWSYPFGMPFVSSCFAIFGSSEDVPVETCLAQPRPLPTEHERALKALVARRRELVEMLTA